VNNPAIVGCEVCGIVKPGYKLFKEDNNQIKEIGEIKQIQKEGENIEQAQAGERVAISIAGPTVGRQINEEDVLYNDESSSDYKKLRQFEKLLSHDEKQILQEIFTAKRKQEVNYGL
jgi:translation initiation factor 5B